MAKGRQLYYHHNYIITECHESSAADKLKPIENKTEIKKKKIQKGNISIKKVFPFKRNINKYTTFFLFREI